MSLVAVPATKLKDSGLGALQSLLKKKRSLRFPLDCLKRIRAQKGLPGNVWEAFTSEPSCCIAGP